jgi:hypothetical protein
MLPVVQPTSMENPVYNSLKRQNRVRVTGQRRTMSAKPLKSGRDESSIASSDEADLIAISNAMRKGQPLYFIRTADGVTMDVMLSKTDALNYRDSARERIASMRSRIQVYERTGTALNRVA